MLMIMLLVSSLQCRFKYLHQNLSEAIKFNETAHLTLTVTWRQTSAVSKAHQLIFLAIFFVLI